MNASTRPLPNPDSDSSDVRLAGAAIRQRWNLSPERREKLLKRMEAIMEYGEERAASAAAKVLMEAARQDQVDIHHLEGSRVRMEVAPAMSPAEALERAREELVRKLT